MTDTPNVKISEAGTGVTAEFGWRDEDRYGAGVDYEITAEATFHGADDQWAISFSGVKYTIGSGGAVLAANSLEYSRMNEVSTGADKPGRDDLIHAVQDEAGYIIEDHSRATDCAPNPPYEGTR